MDPAEAADWAYYSCRWYCNGTYPTRRTIVSQRQSLPHCNVGMHVNTTAGRGSSGLDQQPGAGDALWPIAVDGKKLISRFFQLRVMRDAWVQEVASAATAVITDAELQTDVEVIGKEYALQAAQFDSFYPRFVEAIDVTSCSQPSACDAARFLADSRFKFFAAFASGILGGAQSAPPLAATSIGATAPSSSPGRGRRCRHKHSSPAHRLRGLQAIHCIPLLQQSARAPRCRRHSSSLRISSQVWRCGAPSHRSRRRSVDHPLQPRHRTPQTQPGQRCFSRSLRHCSRWGRRLPHFSHLRLPRRM